MNKDPNEITILSRRANSIFFLRGENITPWAKSAFLHVGLVMQTVLEFAVQAE